MHKIIPAIMPKNYDDLAEKVAFAARYVDAVQIDIMDGMFVPNTSWPYPLPNRNFSAIQKEDEGMPLWEKMNYELDLMIEHPDLNFDQWVKLGPSRIIVHFESLSDPEKFFNDVQSVRSFIEIGLSFHNDTNIESILPYVLLVDCVQVMGIKRIGFQGESFDQRAIENIKILREKFPELPISVDGSVNVDTIQDLHDAGATRFVVGSALFQGGDMAENIEELESLVY